MRFTINLCEIKRWWWGVYIIQGKILRFLFLQNIESIEDK